MMQTSEFFSQFQPQMLMILLSDTEFFDHASSDSDSDSNSNSDSVSNLPLPSRAGSEGSSGGDRNGGSSLGSRSGSGSCHVMSFFFTQRVTQILM